MASRRPFLAGNWKMHGTRTEAVALASDLRAQVGDVADRDIAVFPPFPFLEAVRNALRGSRIEVGAQDCHAEPKGAYTGAVAPEMLRDAGCRYVLVGHSERRSLFGETDDVVAGKVLGALRAGLMPIVCVGETLAERDAGKVEDVLRRQVNAALLRVSPDRMERVTVAYEPVWAIGTGRNATPAQAEEAHAFIRHLLTALFPAGQADRTRIQYGGSVKPDNIAGLMREPDVDGALVGGASLSAASFAAIVRYGKG